MRIGKSLSVLLSAAVAMLVLATAGSAITNGKPDGNNHPYVGLMVALGDQPVAGGVVVHNVPLWRCSGSLLSPTVYLTAGHCTAAPAAHVEVWSSSGPVTTDPDYTAAIQAELGSGGDGVVSCDASPAFDGYPCQGDAGGTPHPNPNFCNPCGNGVQGFAASDEGVVPLDASISVSRYAHLPAAGVIDTLKNKTPIDFVGYGVQFQAQIPGSVLPQPPPFYRWTGPRTRMFAPSELVSGNFAKSDEIMRLALNPGGGSGGTCFGDSGGPDLLGGTDTILGINSFVTNVNCSGNGYSSRVDVPSTLTWINGFLS
jgi:hypothetical protein